ncbi:MAG: hypothetical protein ABEI86_12930 [Halobacteriaceae archaeon]
MSLEKDIWNSSAIASVIIQIYSLTNKADVEKMVELGIDHLGFAVGYQDVPARISVSKAQQLFTLIPDSHSIVTLTVHTDPSTIIEFASTVSPDILHICSATTTVSIDEQVSIKEAISDDIEIMKAINVTGPDSIEHARNYAEVSDYLILDTATDEVSGVGASGETHDWDISKEIVTAVDIPVILAGGLNPENVAKAVKYVQPAGVDSYTHTSATPDRKDYEKVATFAERARQAANSINTTHDG